MTIYQIVHLVLYVIVIVSSVDQCVEKVNEKVTTKDWDMQIKDHILCDYDKKERPVKENKGINVSFYHLTDKLDFSDYGNYITLDGSFVVSWKDEHLYWTPSDFGNKQLIILKSDLIWTPDIVVYNKGQYNTKELFEPTSRCTIMYNKEVACVIVGSISGTCIPDYRHWPLDTQRCTVEVGSWFHAGSEIGFTVSKVMLFGVTSEEWVVNSLQSEVDPGIYKHTPNDTFPSVKIRAVITRKFGMQFVNVVLPFFVLVTLTFITLSLDPRYSERIYFSMLSIPCHIMMLLNYYWDVPESGDVVPYILLYLRNSNLLSSIILIETMIVRYFLCKQTVVPIWVSNFTKKVGDNRIGKFLLYREFKEPNKDLESNDDNGTLVEIAPKPTDWYILGRIIDSSLYFITIIWYIISFLICIT